MFWDIYFLLELRPFDELTNAYTAKYQDVNKSIAANALLFHSEIKFGVDPQLLHRDFSCKDMVQRFKSAIAEPKKIFHAKQGESIDPLKANEKGISQRLRKERRM